MHACSMSWPRICHREDRTLNLIDMKAMTTFSRGTIASLALYTCITFATAQSTPPARENVQQQPSQPTTTAPLPPQQGWMWWDETHGRDMNIAVDRMKELQAVDQRYRSDYDAMGSTPWTNPDYESLTERRNAEFERVLTPEQYQQYVLLSTPPAPTPGTPAPAR